MADEKNNFGTGLKKSRSIIFKIAIGITILGMLVGGSTQFLQLDYQVKVFEQLAYPLYFMWIIGLGKILGAFALSLPRIPPIFRVGAYAGLVFVTIGATISHLITGMSTDAISPFIVCGIAITACLLDPRIRFLLYGSTSK